MTVLAIIGAKSLLLLYLWLASAIVCSYLSARKGFGERPGLATGMLLSVIGVVVWLAVPPKADSTWRRGGALGRRQAADADADADADAADS
jgi:hypothetical protein